MEQENNNFVNIIHGYRNKMPFRLDRKIIYVLNRTGAPSAYDNSVLEGILHKGYEAAFLENTFQDESFVDVVQYYLPFLQIPQNQPSTSFNHSDINDELDCPVHLIFHSDSDNLYVSAINSQADVVAFLANLSNYQDENTSGGVVLFSPYISYEEPLPFDSATQESIDKITDQLQKLNETGQFLNILPFIENELQNIRMPHTFR